MKLCHYTKKQMCLEFDWELPYYRQEAIQATPRDEAPDNSILRPILFVSKTLSSVEKYSNKEREALGILYGLEKFIITALWERWV